MGAPAVSAPVKAVVAVAATGVLAGAAWERWGNRGVLSKPAEVTVCLKEEEARRSRSSSGGNTCNGIPHAAGLCMWVEKV